MFHVKHFYQSTGISEIRGEYNEFFICNLIEVFFYLYIQLVGLLCMFSGNVFCEWESYVSGILSGGYGKKKCVWGWRGEVNEWSRMYGKNCALGCGLRLCREKSVETCLKCEFLVSVPRSPSPWHFFRWRFWGYVNWLFAPIYVTEGWLL